MDFFERQERARGLSARLTLLFILSVVATVVTTHVFVVALGALFQPEEATVYSEQSDGQLQLSVVNPQELFIENSVCNPVFFLVDFLIFGGIILGAAFWRLRKSRSLGVSGVAKTLGGVPLIRGSGDIRLQRLYNVVEEMAIASGTPVPEIFVIKGVQGINACAVGYAPDASAICVTEGALERLTREELQGIVGHEFSHIVNNDTPINMRLIGVLFGLEFLTLIACWMIRSFFSKYWFLGKILFFFAGIGLFCIGFVGLFFGNVIRVAISRQREYLADATAVQFTRNPFGIAGALKKIGCVKVGSAIDSSACEQASHMFFVPVFESGFFQRLYRTHPPLVKRIKALDPTFDGAFPERVPTVPISEEEERRLAGLGVCMAASESAPSNAKSSKDVAPENGLAASNASLNVDAATIYGDWALPEFDSVIGERPRGIRITPRLLEPIPTVLDDVLVDAVGARAAFYAVLFSRDERVRASQIAFLRRVESENVLQTLDRIVSLIEPLPETARLLIVRVATPLIKALSLDDYKLFRKIIVDFCAADGRFDLFEYTLQTIALRELDVFYRLIPPVVARYSQFRSVANSVQTALACLAYEGEENGGDAEKAFLAGSAVFNCSVPFPKTRDYSLESFTLALNDLAQATPLLKKTILEACWRCVLYDGSVNERESALLSAVAAALGAPAPVWKEWSN